MTPLALACILFTLTALGGAVLAAIRLRGAPWPPLWLALGHGAAAALAFAALGYQAATRGLYGLAQIAAGVLVLAALGGATLLLGFHLRNKPLPVALVVGHGAIAIAGVALLWWSVYGGRL